MPKEKVGRGVAPSFSINSDAEQQLFELLIQIIDDRILSLMPKDKDNISKSDVPELRPRDIATLDYAMNNNEVLDTRKWNQILEFWGRNEFSFAKTQASVSMVLTRLLDSGAIEVVEMMRCGSRILRVTALGKILCHRGKQRLSSQKKSPNAYSAWRSCDDDILREMMKPFRQPHFSPIPNRLVLEWAAQFGRTKNAIRSRIKKLDGVM